MPQDRVSGARAVQYGLQMSRRIADKLGAEKIGEARSNEYKIGNKNVVIKCARATTNSVGVTYQMLDRVNAIIGSFETKNGTYDLYEVNSDTFREYMRPTRSTGPAAGRVGIVTKSVFLDLGKFVMNIVFD